ncbi:MAG: hypothetical protein ABL929_07925 [Ferruginibacter sp.]|nr:hypothetical protein [Ferruginibacter sp.]
MTKKEIIKKLVLFSIKDKTVQNKIVGLGIVSDTQAVMLKAKTGFNLAGYKRVIDKYAIKHTLKKHGNEKQEKLRGQIAVTEKDFENIPEIVQSQNVIFSGKNRQGKDCLLYEAKIGNTYYYVEEIRTGKKAISFKYTV